MVVFPPTPGETPRNAMSKSIEVSSEAVRNPKHPFRQVDDRPTKPAKHRYERRKVKEILRVGDWAEQPGD